VHDPDVSLPADRLLAAEPHLRLTGGQTVPETV
jgi:hypothetical protein